MALPPGGTTFFQRMSGSRILIARGIVDNRPELKPKRTRELRQPAAEDGKDQSRKCSQRDLARIVDVYCTQVRAHSRAQLLGIFQQLRRIVDGQGLTLDQLQTAMDHYIADIETTQLDIRFRKNIRTFFTIENVKAWQQPLVRRNANREHQDPALDIFDRFDRFMEQRRVNGG